MMKKLLFLFVLLASFSAQAVNYFSHGFESNTTVSFGVNGAGSIYGYGDGTTRDCTVARSGSCSMKLVVIGNDGGNQGMGLDIDQNTLPFNLVSSQAMFYRFWMRIESGFSWGAGQAKTKSSRVGGATYPRGYTGYVMSYGVLVGECEEVGSPTGGGCLTNTGAANTDSNMYVSYDFTTKNDGVWREYVVMIRPNTSASCTAGTNCNAQLKLWVNNVLIGSYVNFKLHEETGNAHVEQWGGWMAKPYFQLSGTVSDGGTIYIDDISTDTVFNGLTAKPANVRVTDLNDFMRYNVASYRTVPHLG